MAALADDTADFSFGGDTYMAGRSVSLTQDTGSAFMAGNNVTLRADTDGAAHLMGRNVTVLGRVGGNLYGAGMTLSVSGPVAGDASLMGSTITIDEPISGNLRAGGETVSINAPIAGSAMIGGSDVTIDEAIVGDLALGAEDVTWGDRAVIEGELHLYSDAPDTVEVPSRVISGDRVFVHDAKEFDEMGDSVVETREPSAWSKIKGFLGGIILTGLLATLLAAALPKWIAGVREEALANKPRALWIGAAAFSAVIGFNLLLAMTGIGIFALPFWALFTVLVGFGGYLIGAYVLGVYVLGTAGRGMPESFGDRALAGFAGAAILSIVGMIPLIGWWAVLAVLLAALGGVAMRLFNPRFGADTV